MRKLLISLIALSLMLAPVSVMASPLIDVGGVPLCITFTGDSAASAADVTVTTKPGFVPDFIVFFDDFDDLTSINIYNWIYGMGNGSIKDAGTGQENLYVSSAGSGCWFDISTSGQIIVDGACQENSGDYIGWACRYSQ